MAFEIGKRYNETLETAREMYRQGHYEIEGTLMGSSDSRDRLACHSCRQEIEGPHVKIEIIDFPNSFLQSTLDCSLPITRLRFHEDCLNS